MKTTLKIDGMTCQNCVKHVREALESVPGVTDAGVSLDSGLAIVTHDSLASAARLIEAVEQEGYKARDNQ